MLYYFFICLSFKCKKTIKKKTIMRRLLFGICCKASFRGECCFLSLNRYTKRICQPDCRLFQSWEVCLSGFFKNKNKRKVYLFFFFCLSCIWLMSSISSWFLGNVWISRLGVFFYCKHEVLALRVHKCFYFAFKHGMETLLIKEMLGNDGNLSFHQL